MNSAVRVPPPVVDVVIPLYNHGATIDRAVRSVIRQTHERWSLTIVDDGSTEPWSETWSDERVQVVRQVNAGPGAARNNGASIGEAPFLAFLDADDEWESGYLATLITALESDESLLAACASWSGDRGSHVEQDLTSTGAGGPLWQWSAGTPWRALKARVDSLHSSAVIVRRQVFERFGGYYENRCTYGEDSYFWAAVAVSGPIWRTHAELVRFHTDASGLSVGRVSAYPLPPLLTDWHRFEANVGHRWQVLARQYLPHYAQFVLRRSISQGEVAKAYRYLRGPALQSMGVGAGSRCLISLSCAVGLARLLLKRALRKLGRGSTSQVKTQ